MQKKTGKRVVPVGTWLDPKHEPRLFNWNNCFLKNIVYLLKNRPIHYRLNFGKPIDPYENNGQLRDVVKRKQLELRNKAGLVKSSTFHFPE